MSPSSIATPARRSPVKELDDLIREWDEVAELRAAHIADGSDLSYHAVLRPAIASLTEGCDHTHVLDVGCGSGFLAAELADRSGSVVGVDFSPVAIEMARGEHVRPNLTFEQQPIERYRGDAAATLVVSNMTLMAFRELDAALESIVANMAPGGHFVFTIPHPRYWPTHCGYQDESWFTYAAEIPVEWRYEASCLATSGPAVTHFHRPLDSLWASLHRRGLRFDAALEPFPSREVAQRHGKRWRFPHFLAARCRLAR